MDRPAAAMLVGLAVLWGGSFVFVEIILTAVPVLTLVALRVLLAAVTLWIAVAAVGARVPRRLSLWGAFMVMGLFNNAVPFSLIVWGQTEITAGLAAILNATTPLFAALIAGAALADERLTGRRLGGIALGIAGVAVMVGPAALGSLGANVFHQLAVVGAAFSYGLAAVYGRRFARAGVSPLVLAAGQTSASSLIMVPLALAIDGTAFTNIDSTPLILAVVANACLSTALAYLLYFGILSRAGATNAALVTVLVPVVAVLAGVVTLGETITPGALAGMGLIAAGLLVIDGRAPAALLARASRAPKKPCG